MGANSVGPRDSMSHEKYYVGPDYLSMRNHRPKIYSKFGLYSVTFVKDPKRVVRYLVLCGKDHKDVRGIVFQ